jgi:predicted enzyme related to lactoylglutathione lyase
MRIGMTSVFVDDPVKAFHFYTEVLGFSKKVFMPEAGLAIVVSSEDPNGTSLLLEPNQSPVAHAFQHGLYTQGIPVIVFTTADVDKEFQRLSAAGVKFLGNPVKTSYGIEALFEDGFGNIIQLYQV